MPNTDFAAGRFRAVNAPTITWLSPERRECAHGADAARRRRRLDARRSARSGSSTAARTIATVRQGPAGLYDGDLATAGATKGRHTLRAVVTRRRGPRGRGRSASSASAAERGVSRVAVVTGASSGIGEATARRARAARVAVRAARPPPGAPRAARRGARRRGRGLRRLRPRGGRAGRRGGARAAPGASPCSSTTRASPAAQTFGLDPERIEQVLATNFLGTSGGRGRSCRCSSRAARRQRRLRRGHGVGARRRGPTRPSKHAQLAFSRAPRRSCRTARDRRAHGAARLRPDGGVPAARAAPQPVPPPRDDRPGARRGPHPRRASSRANARCSSRAGTASLRSRRRSSPASWPGSCAARATAGLFQLRRSWIRTRGSRTRKITKGVRFAAARPERLNSVAGCRRPCGVCAPGRS